MTTHQSNGDLSHLVNFFRKRRPWFPIALLILAANFFGTVGIASDAPPTIAAQPSKPSFQLTDSLKKSIGESSQLLLVQNVSPTSVEVRIILWERKNNRWQNPFPAMDGVIGRRGFAPAGEKREGDGRTPTGIFRLGTVFGYAPTLPLRMPYRQATADDVWVDEVSSADYNRWVRKERAGNVSYEKMRRDDDLYKYGIVVEYNTNPVVNGMGSAIFVHLWRGPGSATAGCIALAEGDLVRIINWLDPAALPLIVLGSPEKSGDVEK